MRFLFNVNAIDVIGLFFMGLERLVLQLCLLIECRYYWGNSQDI